MTRPTVMCVLTRLSAGGVTMHVLLLTRELTRLGYSTALACGMCGPEELDMSHLLHPGECVFLVPEMGRRVTPGSDCRALFRLWRLMRRMRPDIVHTHQMKAGGLGRIAAKLAGVPVIVHTFHGNVLSGYFSAPVSWVCRRFEWLLAGITDSICVLAPQQAEELARRFRIAPRRKFKVLPLGLDLEPFEALAPPRPDDVLTVGWLGRFVPVKDVPLFVASMSRVFARTHRVRFVIAGDGPDRGIVERAAARFGGDRVTYLGWQDNVTSVIAQCDLLIQTSRNEGTPIALIQGMAAGRPFASTAAGGVVDMVAGVGERRGAARWFDNGVLVDPAPEAFAQTLLSLSADPGSVIRMGGQARQFARAHYGLQAFLVSLETLYSDLLAAKTVATPARDQEQARAVRTLP